VGQIQLRLSGDLFFQRFVDNDEREAFWRVAKLDGENLIVNEPWGVVHTSTARARMNYVRFVPITKELYEKVTAPQRLRRDKVVDTYFEPYSWAAYTNVSPAGCLSEPIAAYAQAKVDMIDTQMGRLGMTPVYPSLVEKPLTGDTITDAPPGGKSPTNSDVWRLAAYHWPWVGFERYAKGFDLSIAANFGAGVAYPGSPLESPYFKAHPEWMRDKTFPLYKYPQVREHFLAQYREMLDRGARNLSIDFCRYPFVVDGAGQATTFLQELRKLADGYSVEGQKRVTIGVRFPVPGNKGEEGFYHPEQWVEQKLVDDLMPSGVVGGLSFFDISPYVKMTRGTGVKCLPNVEAQAEGPAWPGQVLHRVAQLYDQGADGIYIYQADARIVGTMSSGQVWENRTFISKLGSTRGVRSMVDDFKQADPQRGTDIYLFYPGPYQSSRVRIWVDGGQPEEIHAYMNGKEAPVIGGTGMLSIGLEGAQNNYPVGQTEFKVRAKINGKWLTRKASWLVHESISS
jgi:hypothetical protein